MRSCLAVLLFISPLVSGCVSDREKAARIARLPAFECSAEQQTLAGKVSANRTLDSSGRQVIMVGSWDAGEGTFANPWITAHWIWRETSDVDFGAGHANIMWHLWKHRGKRPVAQNLRLELAPTSGSGAAIIGKYEVSGGPFHISLPWRDVIALAASTDRLTLIARDRKGVIVDQTAINPQIFANALPEVRKIVDQARSISADFRKNCKPSGQDDIVIT